MLARTRLPQGGAEPAADPSVQVAYPAEDLSPTLGLEVPTRLLGGRMVQTAGIAWASGLDHVPGLRAFLAEAHHRQMTAGRPWHGHPPICLVGPAGFGRGLLARRISRLTGTPLVRFEASELEAIALRAEAGEIVPPVPVLAMALTRCANPTIAIDLPDGQVGPLSARMLAGMLDPHRGGRWFDEGMRTIFDLSCVSWIVQAPEVTPAVAALIGQSGALFDAMLQTGLLEDLRRLAIAVEVVGGQVGDDKAAVQAVFEALRDDFSANGGPAARLLAQHALRTCLRQGRWK